MSSEVCQLCLEALTPLAEQCAKAQETDSPLFLATRHFLKLVFDMLVLQKHNTEMTTAAGEAFYTLVCLHQSLLRWRPSRGPSSTTWRPCPTYVSRYVPMAF
ncbi:hypothetical protein CB1_000273050 [Camelus ferus]|nr:hypothetical protein CB1_000273050 [Camelus ferus]